MNLVGYTTTALSRNDIIDTPTNKNIVDGAIVELKDCDGNLVTIYDDINGTNPETQKTCDTNGQCTFFAEAGDYVLEVNGQPQNITISVNITVVNDVSSQRIWGDRYKGELTADVGVTLTDEFCVLLYDGNYYSYTGSDPFPVIVASGTVPTTPEYTIVTCSSASQVDFFNGDNLQNLSSGMPSKRDYQYRNLNYSNLSLNGENCISLLGDSISWGQGSIDIRNDSYVGILTKALNYEYVGQYPGFVPLVEGTSDSWDHDISVTGSWSGVSLTNATHIMNGYARTTTSGTARITVTVPVSVSPKCDIWWTRQPTGGTFDVYVNDVFFTTVNTAGGSSKAGWFVSRNIPMTDSGDGNAIISFRPNGDGDVEICGISYGDGAAASFRVQNWSQPGRKARDLSTSVINNAVNGAKTLIFALGHNDQNATGSDLTTALSNIDYVKTACETYGTKLVVLDFIWDKDYTNQVKAKLKEIGEKTVGATYIEFSRSLDLSGALQTASQLISSGFLIDSSHPSADGHKTIAESVAKKLLLGVSSKSALETLDDVRSSVQQSLLDDFILTANNGTITGSVSKYKNQGDTITLVCRARLTSISGSDDIQLVIPSELSPNPAYYTGTGVESQLIPCGIINIGGGGVTNALCQFVSSTIIRVRGTAGMGDNSDVHISLNYTK